jgi:hypothetical protein
LCIGTVLALAGNAAWVPMASAAEPAVVEPDLNAPWPEAEQKGLRQPQPAAAPAVQPAAAPASGSVPAATATPDPSEDTFMMAPLLPPEIKVTKHEISASADFTIGQGDVTLPIGFSLRTSPVLANFVPLVVQPDRDSQYFGASLSYSFGQAWYLDLHYASGDSSGEVELDAIAPQTKGQFEIKDQWYQAYIRYTFPGLRNKRLSAYLRGGLTYVEAEMDLSTTLPPLGFYTQNDETTDLTGNLGFGLLYSVYSSRHVRLGLQLEGEGFYGQRTQESFEDLPQSPGIQTTTATIDNDIYGGIGRATVRFEYRIGSSGLFRAFADGGVQARYTFLSYPDAGSFNELLWGPYVKVGLRYAF